jgi:hypothetical protein
MPASLSVCRSRLQRRLALVAAEIDAYYGNRPNLTKLHRWATQEGFLSSLWQLWNAFARELLISSCQGTVTMSGTTVSSLHAARPVGEIAFLAREFSLGNSPKTVKSLSSSRLEPTWGDISKVQKIISGLNPSNAAVLATGFGSASLIRDVQEVRNASAHLTAENRQKIAAMKVRYDKPVWIHPSDAMFWLDPTSKDFAWRAWLDEMELISLAVSN